VVLSTLELLNCSAEDSREAVKSRFASILWLYWKETEAVNCGGEPKGEAGIAQSWCRVSTLSVPRKNE